MFSCESIFVMALDDFRYIPCTCLIGCSGIPPFCITFSIPYCHNNAVECLFEVYEVDEDFLVVFRDVLGSIFYRVPSTGY